MKLNLKKLFSVILVLSMITTMITVLAEGEDVPAPIRVYGTVIEINDRQITLQNNNESNPYNNIILNLSDETLLLDAVTGNPKKSSEIRKNESITAYVSPAMTKSIPPQSHAIAVFCSIPADFAVPTYATVTDIIKKDGNIIVHTNQDIHFTITDKTVLSSYLTKNIVTMDDIKKGMDIVAWYDIVLESLPAQATPSKVMLIPSEDQPNKPNETPKPDVSDDFFTDVPKDHWAYDEIMYFYNAGIIAGIGDKTFQPDSNVTREEFAKMLAIVFDKTNYQPNIQTFTDVSKNRWSYSYIEAVKEYLTGYYPNGGKPFFNPEAKGKREDIAYALVKINGMEKNVDTDKVLNKFDDSNEISPALRDYMAIAVDLGLMKGDGRNLNPQAPITRAEAVTLLFRAIKAPIPGDDDTTDEDNDSDDATDGTIGNYSYMVVSNCIKEFGDFADHNVKGNVVFKWTPNTKNAEFKAKILVKDSSNNQSERYDIKLTEVIKSSKNELEGIFEITGQHNTSSKKVKGEIDIDKNKLEFESEHDDFEFTATGIKLIVKNKQ